MMSAIEFFCLFFDQVYEIVPWWVLPDLLVLAGIVAYTRSTGMSRRRRIFICSAFGFIVLCGRLSHLVVHSSLRRSESEAQRVFAAVRPGMPIDDIEAALPAGVYGSQSGDKRFFTFMPDPRWQWHQYPGFTVLISTDNRVIRAEWGVPD